MSTYPKNNMSGFGSKKAITMAETSMLINISFIELDKSSELMDLS